VACSCRAARALRVQRTKGIFRSLILNLKIKMEYNTYEDLLKQESEINKNTIEESPEIGWYIQFYEACAREDDVKALPSIERWARRESGLQV